MAIRSGGRDGARTRLARLLGGPQALAFLPAAMLAAWWLGGEAALVAAALGLPLAYAVAGLTGAWPPGGAARDGLTGLMQRPEFETRLDEIAAGAGPPGRDAACFLVALTDLQPMAERYGQDAADTLVMQTAERLESALRGRGRLARIGDGRFALCLGPDASVDLERMIQMAAALHDAAELPLGIGDATLYPACAIGFCLRSQSDGGSAADWLAETQEALAEAQRTGSSGIRAYGPEVRRRARLRRDLRAEAAAALENGQVRPWFQPQISTDTGKVTGFEALARWVHPVHGMVPPEAFLPVMEESGLLERLGEVILREALEAVAGWDRAGLSVPRVGVNFAGGELANPRLTDKVRWELDRLELAADRLSVEILETVVGDAPDERVSRNIAGLAALGCRIDLDDFGTGHASLASVRRFSVSRLKIDRAFVARADRDRQQQRLIAAILTMAERLGLETLAEGVETPGEHALLAQLGCDHVQGFGIGRPMPYETTLDWIRAHEAGLHRPPGIGREAG